MAYLRKARTFNRDSYNKVAAIKAVRSATGIGLKDAKDAVEDAVDRGLTVKLEISNAAMSPTVFNDCISSIEQQGLVLSHKSQKIDFVLEAVKQAGVMAAKDDEYELSSLILNVLVEYEKIEDRREADRIKRSEEQAVRKFKERERREKEAKFEHNEQMRWQEQAKAGI